MKYIGSAVLKIFERHTERKTEILSLQFNLSICSDADLSKVRSVGPKLHFYTSQYKLLIGDID